MRSECSLSIVTGLITCLLALFSAACGQVVTLTPTPTVAPTPTVSVALAVAQETAQPTDTPAPYTPEPTPTPTLSPTPILHIIQAGESLLVVADKYGISIAALQEVNGILDPRTLQIGQQLIIPRPEVQAEGETQSALPTATPMPMRIENVYLNVTTIGGLFVLGEAINDSSVALEQVKVGVTLVDEADKELAQAEAFVTQNLVDAGQAVPFAILLGETPPSFVRYHVYVMHAVPAYLGSYYRDLEVRDLQSASQGYASYSVSGRVANIGPEEAVDVQIVLTAYDALGRVIATRTIPPEYNVVPRGGETRFTTLLAPVGGPVSRVAAVAQGRRKG